MIIVDSKGDSIQIDYIYTFVNTDIYIFRNTWKVFFKWIDKIKFKNNWDYHNSFYIQVLWE